QSGRQYTHRFQAWKEKIYTSSDNLVTKRWGPTPISISPASGARAATMCGQLARARLRTAQGRSFTSLPPQANPQSGLAWERARAGGPLVELRARQDVAGGQFLRHQDYRGDPELLNQEIQEDAVGQQLFSIE